MALGPGVLALGRARPASGSGDCCWDGVPARVGVSTDYQGAGILPDGWLTVLVTRQAMAVRLFAGNDRAGDHHDVEVMDEAGKVPAEGRLPEDVAGIAQLDELTGRRLPGDAADAEVVIGIGAGRGPWVMALIAPTIWCSR